MSIIRLGVEEGLDEGVQEWERRHPRQLSDEDWQRFEGYVSEILRAMGMNLDAPGTRETPQRYLHALLDATRGYEGDAKLVTTFPAERGEEGSGPLSQVIEGPIQFYALCEHHALPFFGSAYVAYVARDRIIGISKLTRLVRLYAARFTVQERIGAEVADGLEGILEPQGAAVYLDAVHLCTQMRGVRDSETRTRTTTWRGSYDEMPDLRHEFLRAINLA
jgi:GTP cyclohydrolase I